MKTAASSLRSDDPQHFSRIIALTLILVAIVVSLIAPVFALRWVQAPFPGAFFWPGLITADTFGPDWAAHALGLQAGDALQTVDDVPVDSGRGLFLYLQNQQVGDQVRLGVERAVSQSSDQSESLEVRLSPFAITDFLIFFWLPFGIGIFYLAMGLLVYRLRGAGHGGRAECERRLAIHRGVRARVRYATVRRDGINEGL